MAFARCAVVRLVSPEAIGPSSTTITERPRQRSSYAVERPAIPAPTMQTSTVASAVRAGTSGRLADIQTDLVPRVASVIAPGPRAQVILASGSYAGGTVRQVTGEVEASRPARRVARCCGARCPGWRSVASAGVAPARRKTVRAPPRRPGAASGSRDR